MESCPQCSGEEIETLYIGKNSLINSSSFDRIETEFIHASEYDYFYKLTAKIPHLFKRCKCSYQWREHPSDV